MKKLLTLSLTLLTALSLTAVAHADVVFEPVLALYYTTRLLPWILVGAVVLVTVFLLIKFWRKKK